MKMLQIFISIYFILFLFGCTLKDKHGDAHTHGEQPEITSVEGNDVNDFAPVLLDQGKKWSANPETTQGIQAMITLVDSHLANPDSDVKMLKEQMMAAFAGIIQKCTMKGESHNQLHNYLLPLKAKVEALENTEKTQELKDLKFYLETYTQYFE